MPTISTLTVDVVANTRSLSRGLKLASTAIIGVGVIATKMALDYNDAFVKIAAVSNASAQDVAKWKDQVLDLAGKTAQAPKELADALFFLASAGLKTSQIMPVLEASAKASAAGLGETADVAKLTANVLNAYAGSGLKAANVTDILVAAVREGSADTDEFGTAIGRILPIASAAGVGFDSVAASLAALSNVGLDVNEGVTAMRGLLQALVAPSSGAATAMASIGLSAQDLLDSLQQDGLIATVHKLDEAIKANTQGGAAYNSMFRSIVPNVRSLTGILGLTQQQAERVDGLFRRVSESTGSLGEAFQTTAEGPGFKFRQALAEIEVLMIRIGDVILPILVAVVQFIQEQWGPAWEALSSAVMNTWDSVKPFAETIGHVLIPLLTTAWNTIKDRLLPALEQLKPILVIIGAAVVLFGTMIVAQFALAVTAITLVIDAFGEVVQFVRDKFVEPIINFLGRVVDFLKGPFMAVWDNVVEPIGRAIGKIIGFLDRLIGKLEDALDATLNLLEGLAHAAVEAGVFADVTLPGAPQTVGPHPQQAAAGGFVARSGLAVIHAGETITPAGMGFSGDINLVVDGKVLAQVTRDQLLKLGNRNAGTGL